MIADPPGRSLYAIPQMLPTVKLRQFVTAHQGKSWADMDTGVVTMERYVFDQMTVCYHCISFVNLHLFCVECLYHDMSSATLKHARNKSVMIMSINVNTNFCSKS